MFQKNSYSVPSDSSGLLLVKVIQTRKCSKVKHAKVGRFLKVVVKNTITELLKRRKKKSRAITIRTMHTLTKNFGLWYIFEDNALVILKKRMNTFGKEIIGSTSTELKIKKFRIAFSYIY